MPRLIDADALGIGKAKREAFSNPAYADGWNSAIEIIEKAPTISPDSLRPKGRWEWYKNHYECTNCRGSRFHDLVLGLDAQYCGRCGADMRGDKT